MKIIKLLASTFFILLFHFSYAQSVKPAPCGTQPYKSEWLKNYQKSPNSFRYDAEDIIYVPLTIHVLGTDDGNGRFSIFALNKALCTLNKDFEASKIVFYIKDDIRYINNDTLYRHSEIRTGGKMMLANNVEQTINCYIVKDPAGNCGYSLPYGGVAMGVSCMDPNDHTWSHEIGHFCSLPHPFLGWEGGVSWDSSVNHNYKDPAPEFVLYDYTDFKDRIFYNDTLIIDTAWVEKVDGSNCLIAADGFCDTKPDYIHSRWDCDNKGESSDQLDPNGEKFRSDGSLFMSYAHDDCSYRFSDDQIAAMRTNIMEVKQNFSLEGDIETKYFDGPAELIIPAEEETIPYKNIHLEWKDIPNAEQYIVYVSRYKNFSNLVAQETTTTNSVDIESLKKNKTYYWKVYAYSSFSFCNSFSDASSFSTSELTATANINHNLNLSVFPKLVLNQQPIQVSCTSKINMTVDMKIYNSTGIQVLGSKQHVVVGSNNWNINSDKLSRGLYFIHIKTLEGIYVEKIIVQ